MSPEERAFIEQLYRDMRGKLLQYAYANLSETDMAEDAVQDAFKIASMKIKNVMDSNNPHGWMVNTLKNILHEMKRNHVKQNNIIARSLIEGEAFDGIGSGKNVEDDAVIVDLMYSGLVSKEEYELLKTVVFNNFSIHETAQLLGISDEACKKRIQRAKAKLKAALDKNDF